MENTLRHSIYAFLRLVVDVVDSTPMTSLKYDSDMSFGYLILWFGGQKYQRFDNIAISEYMLMDKTMIDTLYKADGGNDNSMDWYYSVLAHIYDAYAHATLDTTQIEHLKNQLRTRTKQNKCQNKFLDMNYSSLQEGIRGMGDNAISKILDYDQRSFNFYEEIERYPRLSVQLRHDGIPLNQLHDAIFWFTHYKMVQKFYSIKNGISEA